MGSVALLPELECTVELFDVTAQEIEGNPSRKAGVVITHGVGDRLDGGSDFEPDLFATPLLVCLSDLAFLRVLFPLRIGGEVGDDSQVLLWRASNVDLFADSLASHGTSSLNVPSPGWTFLLTYDTCSMLRNGTGW